jgi:chlorophyllide a reductase subunit Z
LHRELLWESSAQDALDDLIEAVPVLVRISTAKRLRDAAERSARIGGDEVVTVTHVTQAGQHLVAGGAA